MPVKTATPIAKADENSIRVEVTIGDEVRVLTKYGDRPTFVVTNIDHEKLTGEDIQIAYEDMAFIEKLSRNNTTEATIAGAVVATVGILIIGNQISAIEIPGPPY